jgi:hypothetical protein
MTTRLVAFAYEPRVGAGWETPVLEFGASLTAVSGENGSGKTPVMKGIMAALGHEVAIDPDILARCARARVALLVDGKPVKITRFLESAFLLEVSDGTSTTFFETQAAFADKMLELLGIQQRELTTVGNEQTQIYVNLLYPLFWVDQDLGWTSLYATPGKRDFIRSQYTEMVRVLLGLPARHPFRSRDDYDKAKQRLAVVDKHVATQRALVQRLRAEADVNRRDEKNLLQSRDELKAELSLFESALEDVRSITRKQDEEIARLEERRTALLNQRFALAGRQQQLTLALNEIDGEVEVLAANEQATDLLKTFCGNAMCKLFQPQYESYGRTLLFLKDQMKDLKSVDSSLHREHESVSSRVTEMDAALEQARAERAQTVLQSPQSQVQGRVAAVTTKLVDVELLLSRIEQLSREEQRFERSLDEREQQAQAVENLKPRSERRNDGSAFDARHMLAKKMDEWLDVLSTPNLPRGVVVEEDFSLRIKGEIFGPDSSISGSTRTRVVLAFHAALLETALELGGNHPGWLLLDAPKQHELSQVDLNAYIGRLSDVARRHPGKVQTVFSIANTEAPLPLREGDIEWKPSNGVGREAKYLWPTKQPTKSEA